MCVCVCVCVCVCRWGRTPHSRLTSSKTASTRGTFGPAWSDHANNGDHRLTVCTPSSFGVIAAIVNHVVSPVFLNLVGYTSFDGHHHADFASSNVTSDVYFSNDDYNVASDVNFSNDDYNVTSDVYFSNDDYNVASDLNFSNDDNTSDVTHSNDDYHIASDANFPNDDRNIRGVVTFSNYDNNIATEVIFSNDDNNVRSDINS